MDFALTIGGVTLSLGLSGLRLEVAVESLAFWSWLRGLFRLVRLRCACRRFRGDDHAAARARVRLQAARAEFGEWPRRPRPWDPDLFD